MAKIKVCLYVETAPNGKWVLKADITGTNLSNDLLVIDEDGEARCRNVGESTYESKRTDNAKFLFDDVEELKAKKEEIKKHFKEFVKEVNERRRRCEGLEEETVFE